jgi:CRISP-associated protein Cas1
LAGHGIRIRVDHNTLLIRNGLTHFPQAGNEIRLFPGDARLPDRLVILDGSGGVSFEALAWLADQDVELVRLNWRGEVSTVGSPAGYSADGQLAKIQNEISGTKRQFELVRWLLCEKFRNSISTLQNHISNSKYREIAIQKAEKRIAEFRIPRNSISLPKILGAEGDCAAAYFAAWRGIPMNWTGSKRIPIPPNWQEFGTRSMVWKRDQSLALHPINAMLNYAYGVMNSYLRTSIASFGLDLSAGFLHSRTKHKQSLLFDLMEPIRPKMDALVLKFILENSFHRSDFPISRKGGCRVNPQLAKVLVGVARPIEADCQSYAGELKRRLLISGARAQVHKI